MPARRKDIPQETLEELYLKEKLNPKQIGTRLGCSETAVRTRLREYGIPLRSRSQAIRLGKGIKVERDTLVQLYHEQGLSVRQVAQRLGCSEDTIHDRMESHGIARRTPSESARLSRGIDLPKDLARDLYERQGLSASAIAERLGCSATAVRNKLIAYGIKQRTSWAHQAVDIEEGQPPPTEGRGLARKQVPG